GDGTAGLHRGVVPHATSLRCARLVPDQRAAVRHWRVPGSHRCLHRRAQSVGRGRTGPSRAPPPTARRTRTAGGRTMTLALAAGALVAGAVYLFSRREMLRVILGFVLLGHGVNLVLMASGGTDRREPPLGSDLDPATVADPLPQAFILTAIVIAFSITIVM